MTDGGQRTSADRDDWPDLDGLPGVAEAVEAARSAIAAVQRLPVNRRGWPKTAAAAAIRAARASAMLDGGSAVLARPGDAAGDAAGDPAAYSTEAASIAGDEGSAAGTVTDPVLAGAVRAGAAIGELAEVWRHAPLQALARLHVVAAADLAEPETLGRPREAPGVSARLAALVRAATLAPWSGPVMAAVVHGELLTLRPFGSADGVVARAAGRLVMVSSGVDPLALTVPEVGFLRRSGDYSRASGAFASGRPEGVAQWIRLVCAAMVAGAREAQSIARAAGE